MNVNSQAIHVLDSALDIAALKSRGVDTALEFFVIEISHAAVRIGLFQNNRAVPALELVDVLFGK